MSCVRFTFLNNPKGLLYIFTYYIRRKMYGRVCFTRLWNSGIPRSLVYRLYLCDVAYRITCTLHLYNRRERIRLSYSVTSLRSIRHAYFYTGCFRSILTSDSTMQSFSFIKLFEFFFSLSWKIICDTWFLRCFAIWSTFIK